MELHLTIDCHDARVLVPFWCAALDYEPAPPPEGHDTWRSWYLSVGVPEDELGDGDCTDRIRDPEGVRPPIWFQPVPERKTVKNRLHLDLKLGSAELVEARLEVLLGLGATVVRRPEGRYAVTIQDPEGNELCLF